MELPVANKLSAQAQELEDEAVQLEEQKLPIAAAAKLQKAGELHDGARILRQGHSGRVISSAPCQQTVKGLCATLALPQSAVVSTHLTGTWAILR